MSCYRKSKVLCGAEKVDCALTVASTSTNPKYLGLPPNQLRCPPVSLCLFTPPGRKGNYWMTGLFAYTTPFSGVDLSFSSANFQALTTTDAVRRGTMGNASSRTARIDGWIGSDSKKRTRGLVQQTSLLMRWQVLAAALTWHGKKKRRLIGRAYKSIADTLWPLVCAASSVPAGPAHLRPRLAAVACISTLLPG